MAYGGAGQDILFAGTAGDRLIDWTGNHNSFYVPVLAVRHADHQPDASAGPSGLPLRALQERRRRPVPRAALRRRPGAQRRALRRARPRAAARRRLARADRAAVQPDAREPRRRRHRHQEDCEHPAARLPRERLLGRVEPARRAAAPARAVHADLRQHGQPHLRVDPRRRHPGHHAHLHGRRRRHPCDRCRRHRIDRALRREPRSDRLPRRDGHGHRPRDLRRNDDDAQWDDDQEHLDPADAHGRRRPRSRTSRTPRPSTSSSPARSGAPRTSRSPTARTGSPTAKT